MNPTARALILLSLIFLMFCPLAAPAQEMTFEEYEPRSGLKVPAKDRMQLAMALNNLLAAPGFATGMRGPPLDVQRQCGVTGGGRFFEASLTGTVLVCNGRP